jgi:phosphatidylserine/phosphatidylglycerophosphate/cardiolipin synthase-like enzyme
MVNQNQKSVFMDDEVASQVLDIVEEAQKYMIVVTPYLELWGHARTALGLAARRGVKVTMIIRKGEWSSKTWEDIDWLADNGILVLAAEYLHAKIYLNDRSAFVSSMNLTEFSTKNSLEIGMMVQEEQAVRQVRAYVSEKLMVLATPVSAPRNEPTPQTVSGSTQAYGPTELGHCVRCGRPIPPNSSKSLCDDCYDVWAEFGNEAYPERYCHACGKPEKVTYAKPLCRECFRMLRRVTK